MKHDPEKEVDDTLLLLAELGIEPRFAPEQVAITPQMSERAEYALNDIVALPQAGVRPPVRRRKRTSQWFLGFGGLTVAASVVALAIAPGGDHGLRPSPGNDRGIAYNGGVVRIVGPATVQVDDATVVVAPSSFNGAEMTLTGTLGTSRGCLGVAHGDKFDVVAWPSGSPAGEAPIRIAAGEIDLTIGDTVTLTGLVQDASEAVLQTCTTGSIFTASDVN
jgi:hypothetical protein